MGDFRKNVQQRYESSSGRGIFDLFVVENKWSYSCKGKKAQNLTQSNMYQQPLVNISAIKLEFLKNLHIDLPSNIFPRFSNVVKKLIVVFFTFPQ